MSRIRPWYALVAINAVVLGALAWISAPSQAQTPVQDIIRARSIELVNARGEMRAQLHVGETGGGELRFRNGDGNIRVKFGATDSGAILLMMDGTSNPVVRLASERTGPTLRFTQGGGETIVLPQQNVR